jgi:membrane-associated protease RseP (regulator of RpoE activity)
MKHIIVALALAVVGLAAPAAHAQPVADFEPAGPLLHVQITPLTPALRQWFGAPKDAGVLVGEVRADGAGARAGLQVGDVLTQIDLRPVLSADDVRVALAAHKEGDTVKLTVVRGQKTVALTAQVPKPEMARMTHPLVRPDPGYRIEPPGFPRDQKLDQLEMRINQLEQRLQRLEQQPR